MSAILTTFSFSLSLSLSLSLCFSLCVSLSHTHTHTLQALIGGASKQLQKAKGNLEVRQQPAVEDAGAPDAAGAQSKAGGEAGGAKGAAQTVPRLF